MARRSAAEVVTGLAVIAATAAFVVYGAVNTGRGAVAGTRVSAKFENIGALAVGSDVKIGGVTVGRVVSTRIDPTTFQAEVGFTVQPELKLPTDTGAVVSSGGLLGGAFLTLQPGGASAVVADGGTLTITQSAANLEDLLGKFIFNVGSLADGTQKMLQRENGGGRDAAGPGAGGLNGGEQGTGKP